MAQRILSIDGLRRIGAQTLGRSVQQCIWARGRYKAIPMVGLVVFPDGRAGAEDSFAQMQRRHQAAPVATYRALRGLGDRAFLITGGRSHSSVVVAQDGRSFELVMRLKQKPRSQPPPLQALESAAREISVKFSRSPK